MKKLFFIILIIFYASASDAQKSYFLKEGPLQFIMPDDAWELVSEKRKKGALLHFKRSVVQDSVVPEIMIIIEQVPAHTQLTTYSLAKQKPYKSLKDYKIEKVFTASDNMLRIPYAIGQKAHYTDSSGVKHIFYFIHSIKFQKGIQIIIDLPSALFEVYEEEITSFIQSLE